MNEEQTLKALKLLVIFLGMLLLVGFVIVCMGAWWRFGYLLNS